MSTESSNSLKESSNEMGFVYKWTYIPTGQYYIGIHKGNPSNKYIGSGKRFKNKWNKTRKEDWIREIIFEGYYYTGCVKKEEEIVNDELLKDPLCLNLTKGGKSGQRLRTFSRKKTSYRVKPQEVILDGKIYKTRMMAIKSFNISFEELDKRLIEAGWNKSCKFNEFNRN